MGSICKIGFVDACCNGKISEEEYSGRERELTEKKLLGYDAGPNIVWRDSPFARRLENYGVIGRIKNWDCRMKMICPSFVVGFFGVSDDGKKFVDDNR